MRSLRRHGAAGESPHHPTKKMQIGVNAAKTDRTVLIWKEEDEETAQEGEKKTPKNKDNVFLDLSW